MKLSHAAVTVAFGAASTLVACGAGGAPQERALTDQSAGEPKVSKSKVSPPDPKGDSSPESAGHPSIKSDDPLKADVNYWDKQPAFRDSFKSCWKVSSTSQSKLACIQSEMAFQDNSINRMSSELRRLLPEDEWLMLQEDVKQWPSANDASCRLAAGQQDQEPVDEQFCKLYRKTALANYLHVELWLLNE